MTLANIVFLVTLLAVGVTVIMRGGQDERMAAAGIAVASVLSPLVTSHDYAGPEVGLILVDVALLAVLAVIAMRSKSFWPMWATGFQICGLAGHLAAAHSRAMVPAAYAETLLFWSYAVMATVAAGTLVEGRRTHGRG